MRRGVYVYAGDALRSLARAGRRTAAAHS